MDECQLEHIFKNSNIFLIGIPSKNISMARMKSL
jgi:hypothetical protein